MLEDFGLEGGYGAGRRHGGVFCMSPSLTLALALVPFLPFSLSLSLFVSLPLCLFLFLSLSLTLCGGRERVTVYVCLYWGD